jgi:hypothetical protein
MAVPAWPEGAWNATATEPLTNVRPKGFSRRFAYATALLGAVAIAGLTAQASTFIKASYANLIGPRFLFVSSKPLTPMIHAADRLTIAEVQRRMPFSIVVPTGLPANTRFLYAHVLSEHPIPRIALSYEAHRGNRYYRIAISESTVAVGPAAAHFELRTLGGSTKKWTLPMRRWKHGGVVMDLAAWGTTGRDERQHRARKYDVVENRQASWSRPCAASSVRAAAPA